MSYHTIDIIVEASGRLAAFHRYETVGRVPKIDAIDIPAKENQITIPDEKVMDVLTTILKENRLRGTEEYEVLGSLLYNILLDNTIGRKLFDLKSDKAVEKIRIELKFKDEDNRFAHWPWEYLFCPSGKVVAEPGYFISTHPKIILSRPVVADMEELLEPLRVLLVAPGPSTSGSAVEIEHRKKIFGQQLLAYERLFEIVTEILEKNKQISVHQLIATNRKNETGDEELVLTIDDFSECVKQIKPHVIHFLGHGKMDDELREGLVAFTDVYGKVDWISETQFANAIKEAQPKFVFLQACETAALAPYKAISGVARQLTGKDGLSAVIAMQCKINQDSAIDFSRSFYEKLSTTGIIGDAVQSGRQAIMNAKRKVIDREKEERDYAFGIPVLYVKDRTPLFTIKEEVTTEGGNKKGPTSISEVTITCYGGEKKHSVPINVKFCPQGCGEFVDRPVANCVNTQCPQKLLKQHLVCVMCGEKNLNYQP